MSQDIPKNLESPPPEVKSVFDVNWIRENVINISNKINEMELNGKSDSFDFEMEILELYPEFLRPDIMNILNYLGTMPNVLIL